MNNTENQHAVISDNGAIKIALGHQARVGKDTFADYVISRYGGKKAAFASALYKLAGTTQEFFGRPVVKDPSLLQKLGTLFRDHYHENVWVDRLVETLPTTGVIIVTDVRFPNEMEALHNLGFVTVKIIKEDRVIDRDPNHISETALAGATFDYVIHNNGSIEEFYRKIDDLISLIKLTNHN